VNKRQYLQEASITEGLIVLRHHLPDIADLAEVRRLGGELAKDHARVKTAMDEQRSAQVARTGTTGTIDRTIRALRTQHLIRVRRRVAPLFKQEPKILNALKVPDAHAGAAAHVKAAASVYRALRPHVAFCHAEGIRRGFLTDLRAAGERLRVIAKGSDASRLALSRSTWNLKKALQDARARMGMIDSEFRAVVQGHMFDASKHAHALETALSQWSDATKLKSRGGRPRKRKNRGGGNPPPASS
jgi:hypothetical protein